MIQMCIKVLLPYYEKIKNLQFSINLTKTGYLQ